MQPLLQRDAIQRARAFSLSILLSLLLSLLTRTHALFVITLSFLSSSRQLRVYA
jgi:hypothetical protein